MLSERGKTTSRADKEAAFDEIIRELAAASLLSALTGIQRGVKVNGTFSSFMVVGDRLLSIPDIIEQCINDVTNSTTTRDPVSLLGLKSSLTNGLRYEKINKANFIKAQPGGDHNPVMAAAKKRSRMCVQLVVSRRRRKLQRLQKQVMCRSSRTIHWARFRRQPACNSAQPSRILVFRNFRDSASMVQRTLW